MEFCKKNNIYWVQYNKKYNIISYLIVLNMIYICTQINMSFIL